VGQREREAGTLSVRTLDGAVRHGVAQAAFFERVLPHIRQRRLNLDLFGG
jgi:threonyl-tRNA synthetase